VFQRAINRASIRFALRRLWIMAPDQRATYFGFQFAGDVAVRADVTVTMGTLFTRVVVV